MTIHAGGPRESLEGTAQDLWHLAQIRPNEGLEEAVERLVARLREYTLALEAHGPRSDDETRGCTEGS